MGHEWWDAIGSWDAISSYGIYPIVKFTCFYLVTLMNDLLALFIVVLGW